MKSNLRWDEFVSSSLRLVHRIFSLTDFDQFVQRATIPPSRLTFIRRERSSAFLFFFFFSICSAERSSSDFSIATRPLCHLEKPIASSKSFFVRFISLQGRFPRRNAFLRVQSASNDRISFAFVFLFLLVTFVVFSLLSLLLLTMDLSIEPLFPFRWSQ